MISSKDPGHRLGHAHDANRLELGHHVSSAGLVEGMHHRESPKPHERQRSNGARNVTQRKATWARSLSKFVIETFSDVAKKVAKQVEKPLEKEGRRDGQRSLSGTAAARC